MQSNKQLGIHADLRGRLCGIAIPQIGLLTSIARIFSFKISRGESLKKIVIATAMAVMMLCATICIADVDATSQSASTETVSGLGEFNIYFQIDSEVERNGAVPTGSVGGWAGYLAQGADGYIALMDVLTDLGLISNKTIDGVYCLTTPYTTNNTAYGTITKLFGLENNEDYSWNVFIYNGSEWVRGIAAIGLYQPFTDYVNDYRVSNIALYYGDSSVMPVFNSLSILPLTQVPSDVNGSHAADYQVDFTFIRTVNGEKVTTTATGYGSNGFTALQNAIGTDANAGVVGSSNYSTYGWITTLFGIGTVQVAGQETPDDWTDDVYTYWALSYLDGSGENATWKYADLTSAFYGSLDGSALHADVFCFEYK